MSGDWYCQNCGYLSWNRVTFEETCDKCHTPVNGVEIDDIPLVDKLTTEVAILKARIAELEAERRWIPVTERLPEIGVPVWLIYGDQIWIGARCDAGDVWLWGKCYDRPWIEDGIWKCDAETDDEYTVTSWMSLPAPPAEEGEKTP